MREAAVDKILRTEYEMRLCLIILLFGYVIDCQNTDYAHTLVSLCELRDFEFACT